MATREELEQQVKDNAKLIKLAENVRRLNENRDFKALIHDEYLEKEAARLVQLSGDPRLNAEQRADALAMAVATGHLKRFLNVTIQIGEAAAKDNVDCREAIDELEQEEAAEAEQANDAGALPGVEA